MSSLIDGGFWRRERCIWPLEPDYTPEGGLTDEARKRIDDDDREKDDGSDDGEARGNSGHEPENVSA